MLDLNILRILERKRKSTQMLKKKICHHTKSLEAEMAERILL